MGMLEIFTSLVFTKAALFNSVTKILNWNTILLKIQVLHDAIE